MFLYCHLCLFRHNTYLQECTGVRDPSYPYNVHDVKLLVLKFAQEKSFSEDSGGGGRQSNMHLLPYIQHMALYVINTLVAASVSIVSCFWSGFKTMMLYVVVLIYTFRTRSVTREEKNLGNFLDATKDKWIENCYEVLKLTLYLRCWSLLPSALYYTNMCCFEWWSSFACYFRRRVLSTGPPWLSTSSPQPSGRRGESSCWTGAWCWLRLDMSPLEEQKRKQVPKLFQIIGNCIKELIFIFF